MTNIFFPIIFLQFVRKVQYASHIVETDTVEVSHSNVPLSFPNVEPHVFRSTETTVIPKSTLGRGNVHSVSRFVTSIVYYVNLARH